MKVIVPQTIDLDSTSIPANDEPEWITDGTYALDELVQVTDIFPNMVYRSLRAGNTGRYPPENLQPVTETATSTTSMALATGTKTWTVQTGKSFAPGMMVGIARSTTPNTYRCAGEVLSYNSGTGALQVNVTSATGEGTYNAWTVTSEDEIGFWAEVGATNQHAMFDDYVNTRSENEGSIEIELLTTRADHLALFGVLGQSVDMELWSVPEGESEPVLYWSRNVSLIYGSVVSVGLADWYEYFFGEYTYRTDLVAEMDVVTYAGRLKITITAGEGKTAACGTVVVGRGLEIGISQHGIELGILDYSQRDTDEQGRTTVAQGYWAKRTTIPLYLPAETLDSVYLKMAGLRGTPAVWLADNVNPDYAATIVYGLFEEFSVIAENASHCWCDLRINGLI